MRTDIGFCCGQTARTASNTSSGKRSAVLERAAVRVGAQVGQRREEAREQVAVRHVQLEHVEARVLGACAARARTRAMTRVHVGAVHLARHLADARAVRNRRRRHERPVAVRPLVERIVACSQPSCVDALAARVAELHADLRARCGDGRSRRSAATRRRARGCTCRRSPARCAPRATRRSSRPSPARRRRCARLPSAPGASRWACRRPPSTAHIGETTTRFGIAQLAQLQRREHRRRQRDRAAA